MIGKKEKKLIRGCCLYPSIVLTAIIVDVLIGFLWFFLVMLNDMVFNSTSLYIPGLAVYLGIVLVYFVVAVVLLMKVRYVGRTQDWIRLKAGAGLLPSKWEDSEYLRQIHGLNSAANVIIDDPAEDYRKAGYHVLGQLNEQEHPDHSYISLYVGNDGLIQKVDYVLSIDIQATKEENLERVQQNTRQLHRLLASSGAEACDPRLLEFPEPPAGFVEQFTDGTYYESINLHHESANCSAAYMTDPEDVNNEYDSFYFYLRMGEGI